MATVNRALSIEDGNLSSQPLITTRDQKYSDIDLTFAMRPDGDVFRKLDAAAVKQAIKNLLLTGVNEKPFVQGFGGGLGNILFELVDEDSESEIEVIIQSAIDLYEPRAVLEDLKVDLQPDRNTLHVRVICRLINTQEIVTIDTTLSRVR